MSDPPRLREPGSNAPPELRELFRDAEKPDPLTAAADARLLGQVKALGPAPATVPFKSWLLAGGAILVLGTAAIVARHSPAPPALPSPPPDHSIATPASAAFDAPAARPVDAPAAPAVVPSSFAHVSEALALPPSKHASPASASQGAPAEAASTSQDALAGEAKLLNQAHAAMASDPRKAYEFANEHARRYPHGQLAAERELILVQALVKLGRLREAEARGSALRKSSPSSIYGERLDTILPAK